MPNFIALNGVHVHRGYVDVQMDIRSEAAKIYVEIIILFLSYCTVCLSLFSARC